MKTQKIEEDIQSSFALPEPTAEFKKNLDLTLRAQVSAQRNKQPRWLLPNHAWAAAYVLTFIAILATVVFALGPKKVLAQIQSWFGFIPGIGLVSEDDAALRVLAEPASQTLDGITLEISKVIASSEKTYVDYQVFGLTNKNFPNQESDLGCRVDTRLKLPNGTNLSFINGYYEAIPKEIDQLVLHLSCIPGTDPAKTPSDWQVPFALIAAEDDLVIMPVVLPEPRVWSNSDGIFNESTAETPDKVSALQIHTVAETPKGYIIIGWVETDSSSIHYPLNVSLSDSSGKDVPTKVNQQVSNLMQSIPSEKFPYAWGFEFDSEKLSFPLTLSLSVFPNTNHPGIDPARLSIDLGAEPQSGQTWETQQIITLGNAEIIVNKLEYVEPNGLKVFFSAPDELINLDIQFPDLRVTGSGGGIGKFEGLDGALSFERSFMFETRPSGMIEILFSNPVYEQNAVVLSSVWQPATPHANYPESEMGICQSGPIDLPSTEVPVFEHAYTVVYRQSGDGSVNSELVYLDSLATESIVLSDASAWVSLSPDGMQVLFPSNQGGSIRQHMADNQNQLLTKIIGFDSKWSPDSNYIAYIRSDGDVINTPAFAKVDGSEATTISELGYAMIAGWSPDSRTIYFTLPWLYGPSWKVMAYDIESKESKELFTIQNGTPKYLNPQISPNEEWLSYRGADSSSLYLVSMDGKQERLLLDYAHVKKHVWLDDTHIAISISHTPGIYESFVLDLTNCGWMSLDKINGELVDIVLQN